MGSEPDGLHCLEDRCGVRILHIAIRNEYCQRRLEFGYPVSCGREIAGPDLNVVAARREIDADRGRLRGQCE